MTVFEFAREVEAGLRWLRFVPGDRRELRRASLTGWHAPGRAGMMAPAERGWKMIGLTAEQRALLEEARNVWRDMEQAKSLAVPWGEEAITTILIRNLRSSYPGDIEVIPFSKPLEGETGADWIWSFENAGASASATMLVQAKRLDDAEARYPDIGRRVGTREPPVLQIEQLLATAAAHAIPAAYAFYNHVSDPTRVPVGCHSLGRHDPDQVAGFGIAIADAGEVKATLPDASFDSHVLHSIPLHCLLCNGDAHMRRIGGSPEAIVRWARDRLTARRSTAVDDAAGPGVGATLGFLDGPSPLVGLARNARAAMAEGAPPQAFDLPPVAGIVVFRDGKDPYKRPSS